MADLPSTARVVIIGGGAVGAAEVAQLLPHCDRGVPAKCPCGLQLWCRAICKACTMPLDLVASSLLSLLKTKLNDKGKGLSCTLCLEPRG